MPVIVLPVFFKGGSPSYIHIYRLLGVRGLTCEALRINSECRVAAAVAEEEEEESRSSYPYPCPRRPAAEEEIHQQAIICEAAAAAEESW